MARIRIPVGILLGTVTFVFPSLLMTRRHTGMTGTYQHDLDETVSPPQPSAY